MTLSRVPELRQLQALSGPGACCFCLRPLVRRGKTPPIACWSAECRGRLETARSNHRYAATRGLRALRDVVAAIGWSTAALTHLTGATR